MSLSFIKALYCDKANSGARSISETIVDSMILPVGRCLRASLEKGSLSYPHIFCFKFFRCSTWILIPRGVISLCFCNSFLHNVWIWIVLTQQFTASMSVLNPERNGAAVLLLSLLNNYVNKSPWTAEHFSPVILPPIPLVFKSWNAGWYLFIRDGIGRNFDVL